MATKLFLRDTTTNGIGAYRDMLTTAGSVAADGVVDTVASGTEIQWTVTAGGAVLEWISGRAPVGGFTLAGTMTFSIWARENNMNANCGARSRVFKRTAAGSESEVGGGPYNDGVEFGTAFAEMVWTGTPTSTAFAEDDRIIVRYYITNVGTMGGGFTCTINYDAADAATGDSFFQINENVTFKAEAVNTTLTADAGSYTQTGTAASLERGLKITADAGSYAQTGTAAGLAKGFKVVADAGSFTLSGTSATLSRTHILVAAAGAYAYAGTAAGLAKGFKVVADPGSYALTGTAANLLRGLKIGADAGSYALTGTAATLRRAISISAASGAYAYTGTAATLTKGGSGVINYTLEATPGSYALTGIGSSLWAPVQPAPATWSGVTPAAATWTPVPPTDGSWS